MKQTPVKIEFYYFHDCPGYKQAWSDLLEALVQTEVEATIQPVAVGDMETAAKVKFGGSPSIKINGADLEGYDGPGALVCRLYRSNENKGWPGPELIVRRLKEAVPEGANA